ncbi:MAG: NAD(P)/FAD-dependent oxidoreductase [Flavobacteriales bacterium]
MIHTDILIIGASPVGLFAVFEAGLLQLRCHIIDALPQVGGQLSEIYPKKPIYDIPGFPEVLAGDLVKNLEEQIAPFNPGYTLGEKAETLEKLQDGSFKVTSSSGLEHYAKVVFIAGGLGSFEPRKPPLERIEHFEGKGVDYFIKEPEVYRDKHVVIAGGGDSALDWAIFLQKVAKKVTLVHRRKEFRGALDSVEKVRDLVKTNDISLITEAEVKKLLGENQLKGVNVKHKSGDEDQIQADYFLPLFGLTPKIGPIGGWGLDIEKNAIKVNNAVDYQTNIPGVFAIGDVNTYTGKLKLILCGFHEAAIAAQFAYNIIHPGKRFVMKYTTVNGVNGFDGVKKESKKQVVNTI